MIGSLKLVDRKAASIRYWWSSSFSISIISPKTFFYIYLGLGRFIFQIFIWIVATNTSVRAGLGAWNGYIYVTLLIFVVMCSSLTHSEEVVMQHRINIDDNHLKPNRIEGLVLFGLIRSCQPFPVRSLTKTKLHQNIVGIKTKLRLRITS